MKEIKMTVVAVEVIEHDELKTFIVRNPQTGQILCFSDNSAEVSVFLSALPGNAK